MNINEINHFKNLETVIIPNSDIKNVDFLKGLTKLKKLRLNGSKNLYDIKELKDKKDLTELNLRCTKIDNIEILKELKNLKELNVEYNIIKDTDIAELKRINKDLIIEK